MGSRKQSLSLTQRVAILKMADEEFTPQWLENFLNELLQRPKWMTEVRRDGKGDAVIENLIRTEFDRRLALPKRKKSKFIRRMREFAAASWKTCEKLHLLMLDDDQPENEKVRLDPDHWYENNLTNAILFANLSLEGLHQLVPGRLFTTRMPRNIVEDPGERKDFVDKCKKNQLKVICVLTEPEEFKKYSGMDGLLDFYREECGLTVYNRAIPDFQIPTSGDLVNNILDLTYHLSKGENCLVHCAGGSGRTGMVIAAIVKNLGLYDPVARIRRVKSTYVETYDQELFLKNMPKAIDTRILKESPELAMAIAAEHLIQVFYTHGSKLEQSEVATDVIEQLDDKEEDTLMDAYMQTFDLVDADGSGTLDKDELIQWLTMCGAELDLKTILDVLLQEGNLTREKFAKLMSSYATSSRRDYDISGTIKSSH